MSAYDLYDRIIKIGKCLDYLSGLIQYREIHGLDCELLSEEIQELIRAGHDTIREFEAEFVKLGRRQIIKEITTNVVGERCEDWTAEVAGVISRS